MADCPPMSDTPPYVDDNATTAVAETKAAEKPVTKRDDAALRARIKELEAAVDALSPKPVDPATLPDLVASWEFRRPYRNEADGAMSWVADKIESSTDPKWDKLEGTVVPHGTFLVERLTYDGFGKIVSRATHASYQTATVSDARGRMRGFEANKKYGFGGT